MTVPILIANWEDNFEIAQSRRRGGRLSWVAMPTRHDSRGYRKLIRSKDGVQHFACWVALVQVAARCEVRGTLASDSGVALTTEDFEAMTDIPSELFDAAIPILCAIGWLLCPKSEHARSEVGACSETDTTTVHNITVHNSTVHNKTEQYITGLKNQHRSIQIKEAKKVFDKIPSRKRRGYKAFCRSYIEEVIEDGIEHEIVADAILAYYESPEGRCAYFREPARLVDDRIWDEDRESWTREDRKENKLAATQQEQERSIDHLFDEQKKETA